MWEDLDADKCDLFCLAVEREGGDFVDAEGGEFVKAMKALFGLADDAEVVDQFRA